MKWFLVEVRIVEDGGVMNSSSHQCGTSEKEVKEKYVKSLKKSGWLGSGLTEFKLDVKLDSRKTKYFDDNDLWGPYL